MVDNEKPNGLDKARKRDQERRLNKLNEKKIVIILLHKYSMKCPNKHSFKYKI